MNNEEDATNGESYEDEDCMEVWDSTSRMTGSSGGGGGGGEGDDGSLATSSSIPSIRMAARLNSSTTMYEEDASLCGTYDGVGGGMGFDMGSGGGGGASFFGVPAYSAATTSRGGSNGGVVEDGYAIHVDHTSTPMSNNDGFLLVDPEDDVDSQYMDEYHQRQQQQQQQQQPPQQQYHPHQQHQHLPPDMAVTPSPPRRAARSFFDDDTMGGGEQTKQIKSQPLRNGAMEWLRTVEVGRNNRYVAEAASSKFLTGKRSHPNTMSNNVSSNRMMGGGGLGSVGGGLIQGYPMGKRVHSDGAAIAPKTTYLKGKRGVPIVTTNATAKPKPSNLSTTAATTNGTTTIGTGNASNIVRSQVMGRSINTSHGPTTGVRRNGRGTKNVSRPRLSAVMR